MAAHLVGKLQFKRILRKFYLKVTSHQPSTAWSGKVGFGCGNLIWGWHSLRVTDKNQWLERLVDSGNVI